MAPLSAKTRPAHNNQSLRVHGHYGVRLVTLKAVIDTDSLTASVIRHLYAAESLQHKLQVIKNNNKSRNRKRYSAFIPR